MVDLRKRTVALLVLVLSLLISGCGPRHLFGQAITPTTTFTQIPPITPTLTSTPTPILTSTPTPTPTSTSTSTLTPPPTLSPTITPTPLGGGLGKIVFVSERNGNPEIYVMNSDGSGQTRLTSNAGVDEYPNWSPDGRKIVYTSEGIDTGEVFVINADGSGETNLTHNPQYFGVEKPKWSPD